LFFNSARLTFNIDFNLIRREMKTAAIIKEVKDSMYRMDSDNATICFGVLSNAQITELRKTFDVKKGMFGYWEFKKLT